MVDQNVSVTIVERRRTGALMRHFIETFVRLAQFFLVCVALWWAANVPLAYDVNLFVVVGGVAVTYPMVWLARKLVDMKPTASRAVRVTTFLHVGLLCTFGIPLVRAVITHRDWPDWVLPVPPEIGLALVILTGTVSFLVVLNLALKGLGAPGIVLSRKLAVEWMYAWTRNPMVLAALTLFLSVGIWFQSALFMLWVLVLFAPALLFFLKMFEERELEIRFGEAYLEYKSSTPMLLPRRPTQ